MPADKDQDIKERYREIKARNEKLKVQAYAQYLKMTSPIHPDLPCTLSSRGPCT